MFCLFPNCYWFPWDATLGSWFGCFAHGYCFYNGGNKISIFIIQSMSFRSLLTSIKPVSYSYYLLIAYITIGNWGPVISWSFNCSFLISVRSQSNFCWEDSVIGRYSFKRKVCLTVQIAIYPLLVYKHTVLLSYFGKCKSLSFLFFLIYFFYFLNLVKNTIFSLRNMTRHSHGVS